MKFMTIITCVLGILVSIRLIKSKAQKCDEDAFACNWLFIFVFFCLCKSVILGVIKKIMCADNKDFLNSVDQFSEEEDDEGEK
uniref:Uncharacterized protein n=1 Tax=Panagrolaimus sp. PS1159 TaxID=55785 RepID=A0AC35G9X5_9BILA